MRTATETGTKKTVKVTVQVEVEEQRISDMLCSAFEGGVGYWTANRKSEEKPFDSVAGSHCRPTGQSLATTAIDKGSH